MVTYGEKLSYCSKDSAAAAVRGKEAPRSTLDVSCEVSELDRCTSKSSQKTSHGNSVKLKVWLHVDLSVENDDLGIIWGKILSILGL
ncbi:hypothetical protein MKX03_008837 [Papaver bracteatum]|nr:hypothetical protein MKX03_008837 [Papaver bracteatum]